MTKETWNEKTKRLATEAAKCSASPEYQKNVRKLVAELRKLELNHTVCSCATDKFGWGGPCWSCRTSDSRQIVLAYLKEFDWMED